MLGVHAPLRLHASSPHRRCTSRPTIVSSVQIDGLFTHDAAASQRPGCGLAYLRHAVLLAALQPASS